MSKITQQNLIQLIKKSVFLAKGKRDWLLANLKNMNKFQKKDLLNLLQSNQQKVDHVFDEADQINDPKFWQDFKNYKNSKIKQTYSNQESEERREDNKKADRLFKSI